MVMVFKLVDQIAIIIISNKLEQVTYKRRAQANSSFIPPG